MAVGNVNRSHGGQVGAMHIALLRGINVGGKNRITMKDLRAIFERAGCADVRTYIQSGNVVFRANAATAKGVPDAVSGEIERRFHLRVPVVMRTAAELQKIVKANPFLKSVEDARSLHVIFLADKPEKRRVAKLDPDRSPGDSFIVSRSEIFLHLPNGVARTKLTNAYFDSTLQTTSTGRNWRTVLTLAEMAEAED